LNEDTDMSLTHLMLLSLPLGVLAFKLSALGLATVWALSAAFQTRGLLPSLRPEPVPAPVPARRSRR
jgi:hypothetical protein